MAHSSWMDLHIQRWRGKPQLRYYYTREIFNRITKTVADDRTVVEVGCGPGFLRAHIRNLICVDVEKGPAVTCLADATRLPFADSSVDAYVGIDVLHHFNNPDGFFQSASASLKPSGKIVLVEPWAGPAGFLFYRFFHHEDCHRLNTPFGPAFDAGKSAMDGNAMIPRQCLIEKHKSLERYGLRVESKTFFGSISYMLTGGFQSWGAPLWLIRMTVALESLLPPMIMRIFAIRMIVILQKI